jgi:hypothetical protein
MDNSGLPRRRQPRPPAFAIDTKEVDDWKSRLAAHSMALESEVTWPTGTRSLYFRDPDQNLTERLAPGS